MRDDETPIRVCVIEDDPDMLGFFTTVLRRRLDAEVLTIADPRELEARWSGFVPDVVLTDIELPGRNGLDLIDLLRSRYPGVPIVITTAHVSVDNAVTALRRHADEFLPKPVTAARLVEVIEPLARRGRRLRESATHQRVLAVGAHPDDVEIGVGGILGAHRDAGDSIAILTLSGGARGGSAADRHLESIAAAELLDARLFLEDLVDTRIDPAGATIDIVERVVDEIEPTVVYTHSAHDRHQDHRAVHTAVDVGTRRVRTVSCFQSPSATIDFRPSRFVPIDSTIETKLRLLACFASQNGIRDYMEPDFVRASARYWSRFGGARYCEPLEVIRDTAGILPPAATPSEILDEETGTRR